MGEYDSCEHCAKPKLEDELIFAVDYWAISQWDGRRRPSYWLVCGDCYDTRHQWEVDAFPDICESCGSGIPYSEHHFEKEYNHNGERIVSHGLAPDETCRIVCEGCYRQLKET